jgi:hypothetical protein
MSEEINVEEDLDFSESKYGSVSRVAAADCCRGKHGGKGEEHSDDWRMKNIPYWFLLLHRTTTPTLRNGALPATVRHLESTLGGELANQANLFQDIQKTRKLVSNKLQLDYSIRSQCRQLRSEYEHAPDDG